MSEHKPDNHEHSEVRDILRQLPRATAPIGFEETVSLRRLLQEQLPRATAPEGFEEEVLSCLRKEESSRRRLRRLRLPKSPRTWIAIGVGAAIVGGIAYYSASKLASPQIEHYQPPTPQVLPLVIPTDSAIEEPVPTRQQQQVPPVRTPRETLKQQSTAPTKRVTPGVPDHDDEE
jgi:hypothetical protein